MTDDGKLRERTPRHCTRCGKRLGDVPYELWLFHTCRHCAIDADGRWKTTGTYRKWRYFPRWHMCRHPDLPEHKRARYEVRA